MKRAKKTYAVYNLTEKHTVFYLGKTKVRVSFTGGIVTKKGVTPATFTTDNPIVQMAIEKSEDFAKGVVKVIAHYPLAGDVKVGKNAPKRKQETKAQGTPSAIASTQCRTISGETQEEAGGSEDGSLHCVQTTMGEEATMEEDGGGCEEDSEDRSLHCVQTTMEEDEATMKEAGESCEEDSLHCVQTTMKEDEATMDEGITGEAGLEVVEASCKDVAKQYLQDHFGVNPVPLRTRAQVQEAAAKYGITFNFV